MGWDISRRRILHGTAFSMDYKLCPIHHSVFFRNHHLYDNQRLFEIQKMIEQFAYVIGFLAAGILFIALILFISRSLRPYRPNVEKLSTYESGEEPMGNANIRFNPRFYVIALLFVLFEVELIFLFPWAVVFGNKQLASADSNWPIYALVEMFIFVGILALGLAFAWVKGYLTWEKPAANPEKMDSPIPMDVYKKYLPNSK